MARGAAGGVCGLGKGRRRRASQPGVGGGGRRGGGDPGSEAERAGCGNIPRNPGHAEGAGRGSPCGPPASTRARPRLPPKLREPRCSPRAAALHGEKGSAEAERSRSPPAQAPASFLLPARLPRPSSSPPGSSVLPPAPARQPHPQGGVRAHRRSKLGAGCRVRGEKLGLLELEEHHSPGPGTWELLGRPASLGSGRKPAGLGESWGHGENLAAAVPGARIAAGLEAHSVLVTELRR